MAAKGRESLRGAGWDVPVLQTEPTKGSVTAEARSGRGRYVVFAAKLLVGYLLIAVLAWRVDLRTVWEQLVAVAPWALVLAGLVYAASVLVHTWRWRLVLDSRNLDLGRWETTQLILGANFLNLFMPGNIGGDVYRIHGLRRDAASLLQSTGLVIIDRYAGFSATFLIALAAIVASDFALRHTWIALLVSASFLVFVFPLCIAARPGLAAAAEAFCRRLALFKTAEFLARTTAALGSFLGSASLVLQVMALSIAMKMGMALTIYLLAIGLGLPMQLEDLLVFLPIHTVVSALPVSVNGLGLREANLVSFFTQMGMTEEQSASLAFLLLIWIYATGIPGGIVLLRGRQAPAAN